MKNATHLRWLIVLSLFPTFLFSQQPGLKLKLQLMPDGERWGVYVKPDGINPNTYQTITTGGGQVTVIMPLNYTWGSLTSVNGFWAADSQVHGPAENPTKSYIAFGFQTEVTPIPYQAGIETLLFTFKGDGGCPDSLYLIDNANDPFNDLPNSEFNSPGNELSVFDMITGDIYTYGGNYAQSAWSCHDNDGDGVLNAHEDTNGNGVFDDGVDASDLGQYNGYPIKNDIHFKLQLMPDGENWGVYAKATADAGISQQTVTGTAQITIVAPKEYQLSSTTNINGIWSSSPAIHGPAFAPDKSFWSFGFTYAVQPIVYKPGEETLLFTFKKQGECPNDLHIYDNDQPAPDNFPYSLGNEITVVDIINDDIYGYGGNFGEMAWDCHDNDGDGLPNAHEDTNGNGVFDLGVDASDLNSAPLPGCVKLKLQLLPDSSGWAVEARPFEGFAPSATASLVTGRVTIVTPADFEFGGFQTQGGAWSATTVLADMPNNPNRKYITFELTDSNADLSLVQGQETVLFQFAKMGDCPDSLFILEGNSPNGPLPNVFSGETSFGLLQSSFDYCGAFARKDWRCKNTGTSLPPIIITPPTEAPESFKIPMPATDRAADFADGKAIAEGNQWFTASPNPAGEFVNILVAQQLAEGQQTLSLWDLQGKKRLELSVENAATQLDLSGLPAGVYLVSLAQNGRVLQREELIKH